jgi:hypothetical protein
MTRRSRTLESGDTDLRIGRSLGLRTTQLGSAFEREHRNFLWQRTRLVLGIGLALNVLLYGITLFVPLNSPVTGLAVPGWKSWADLLYPGSFGIALAWIHIGRPGVTALQVTVFVVAALNLLAGLTEVSLTQPDVIPGFGVALVLFIPAAFIPWREKYQGSGVTEPSARSANRSCSAGWEAHSWAPPRCSSPGPCTACEKPPSERKDWATTYFARRSEKEAWGGSTWRSTPSCAGRAR